MTKGITPAARRIPDAGRVRFGRPENPSPEDVLKAPTWEDFYKQCRERKIAGDVLEDLILRRMSQDLGLDTERAEAMKKLFKAEQEAATRAIFENAGGMAGIEKLQEEMGMNWKTIYDDWRRQRDVVRQAYNGEYLKVVTYDKLNYFNEHLRNAEINFFASYGPDSDYFLIGGVGKMPK